MSASVKILLQLSREVAPDVALEAQLRSYLQSGGIELEGVTVEEVLAAIDSKQDVRWADLSYRFHETLFYHTARINSGDASPDDVVPVVTACLIVAGGIGRGFGTGMQLGNILGALYWIKDQVAETALYSIVRIVLELIGDSACSFK